MRRGNGVELILYDVTITLQEGLEIPDGIIDVARLCGQYFVRGKGRGNGTTHLLMQDPVDSVA